MFTTIYVYNMNQMIFAVLLLGNTGNFHYPLCSEDSVACVGHNQVCLKLQNKLASKNMTWKIYRKTIFAMREKDDTMSSLFLSKAYELLRCIQDTQFVDVVKEGQGDTLN